MGATQKITVSTSPFLHSTDTTPRIMWEVFFSLMPMVLAAGWYFGVGAIAVILSSMAGCMMTEYVFDNDVKKGNSLKDGSAAITGILLAMCLPPGFPLWMAFLGGVVAVGMGKAIWGGMGQNVFNPALLGRAFLQAAFPTAITTWTAPGVSFFSFSGTNLALPFFQGENIDGVTTATPLAQMKFEHLPTSYADLLLGSTGGSLGETFALLFILAGIYLLWRRIINWRIPVSLLGTVAVFSGVVWWLYPDQYPDPVFMLLSGGLLLGTVYMATDLVTSPITPKGLWFYGIGIGILVVLIRLWGGLPEGVMYAILLMNAATPLLNRYTKIKPYGRR
jgi:electron transport complex protein RnfD